MITRTVLEWRQLGYGDGEDQIPEAAAARLAQVAKASPLGGEDGVHIVQFGREKLRAQQVVGVLAGQDCVLEILPKIDGLGDGESGSSQAAIRQNLIHMLAKTLDIEIAPGRTSLLGWQKYNLLEILIKLFCDRLIEAVHRGMPRRYVGFEDDLPMLRGRLNVIRQFSTLAATPNRLASRFEELSSDIALNQIMKAAVRKLFQITRAPENQRKLRELGIAYAEVKDVGIEALRWDQVVLDRTNSRWQELLTLARLLLGNRFQTTSLGANKGFSLLFEMNTLFEEYVGRCLRQLLAGTGLSVDLQGGRRFCLSEIIDAELPAPRQRFMTKPDIIIRRGKQPVLIIDTKWKRLANAIDDPKQGVSQADVYQMMAYGRIYECPDLMLLYPHHHELRCDEGITSEHQITGCEDRLTTATIGLADLTSIMARLRQLLAARSGFSFFRPDLEQRLAS